LPITICGIDEAGRGPLAGHLVVAGVVLHSKIPGLNDSKKLSEPKRRQLFEKIVSNSTYHYKSFSPQDIDTIGISKCIKSALEEILASVSADKYIFDGNTTFGANGIETLVKADSQVEEVMAASIVAKTIRDDLLMKIACDFQTFSFASHKGYGTAKHLQEIKEYGITPVHRVSFLQKYISANKSN
jgi:ribonuclease HII